MKDRATKRAIGVTATKLIADTIKVTNSNIQSFILLELSDIILQTHTYELLQNKYYQQEGTTGYPNKIKALCGKDFTFKVQITNDNVLVNSKIFEVTDAFDKYGTSSSNSDASMPGYSAASFSEVSNEQTSLK